MTVVSSIFARFSNNVSVFVFTSVFRINVRLCLGVKGILFPVKHGTTVMYVHKMSVSLDRKLILNMMFLLKLLIIIMGR
jgi:hypothetical protein